MSDTDFNVDELLEFEQDLLNKVSTTYPEKAMKLLDEVSSELVGDLERDTPISDKKKRDSKRMKNRWKIGKIKNTFYGQSVNVKNTAPHAWLYENGHIAENGRFIKGSHMFEQRIDIIEQELPRKARKLIDEVFGD